MKLQQSNLETLTSPGWMDDVRSMFQCGILLVLGYVVTRAWLWYRRTLLINAKLQHIDTNEDDDDDDLMQPSNDNGAVVSASSRRTTSTRQANAHLRKRARKGRASESSIDIGKVATEEQTPTSKFLEEEAKLEPVSVTDSFHLAAKGKKKSARAKVSAGACTPKEQEAFGKTDSTSESQDNDMGDGSFTPASEDTTDTSPLESIEEAGISSDKITTTADADEMTSQANGDSKEDPCKPLTTESLVEELATPWPQPDPMQYLAEVASQRSPSPWPEPDPTQYLDDDVSQRSPSPWPEPDPTQYLDEDASQQSPLAHRQPNAVICTSALPCHVNWDLIESDSDDDMDAEIQSANMPGNTPILWCSAPQSPMNAQESSANLAMVQRVEGWVPVAIPTDCAPPGALDGLWMNRAGEKILIERLDIMFESGVAWNMKMHSPTHVSVDIDGAEFCADLDEVGEHLIWNDGDVWDFHGRIENAAETQETDQKGMEELKPPWHSPHFDGSSVVDAHLQPDWNPQAFGEPITPMHEPMHDVAQSMMWENMSMGYDSFMISPVHDFVDTSTKPLNQSMPAEAEQWEICWDWKKKGCCPRGAACDWYHPDLPHLSACQPCDTPFFH